MKVTLDIVAGNYPYRTPRKKDVAIQIEVLEKVIDRKPLSAGDIHQLIDVKSIMEGLQEKL